tara:strand:- start:21 stop:308 length:288 start_codon:yes stop_codon:yes gene_type:complete
MNEELNDVVKTLRANGDRLTGEDGGRVIDILSINLKPLKGVECGLINHGMGQLNYLCVFVYVWGDYKFVVQNQVSGETNPIWYGTVDLYNNGDPR